MPVVPHTGNGATRASQVLAARPRQNIATDAADIKRHLPRGLAGVEHIEHVVLLAEAAHRLGGIDQSSVGRRVRHGHHGRAPGQFSLQVLKIDLTVFVVLNEHHFDAVSILQLQQGDDVADLLCSTGKNPVARHKGVAVDRHVPGACGVLDHGHLVGLRADKSGERRMDGCETVCRFGCGLVTTDGCLAFKMLDNRGEHDPGWQRGTCVVEVQDMVDSRSVRADLVERQPRNHRLRIQSDPRTTRGAC